MKTYKRLHTFAAMTALFCCVGLTAISCSSDDDMYYDYPESVISLNMMNESNGNTKLGDSDVYINNADNFTSSSSSAVIASLGVRGNFMEKPMLSQLAKEVAVAPGEFYQVLNDRDIKMFASGKRALSIDSRYYNMYVAGWINSEDGKHIGARVSYNICNMDGSDNLPEWNTVIGTLTHFVGNQASWVEPDELVYTFPAGVEINVDYNGWENYLSIEVDGNVVTASIPNNRPWVAGQAYLYVRDGSLYTRVIIAVDIQQN